MSLTNNNGFSSFWFDENEGNRVNDVLGIEEKHGVDLIKLASNKKEVHLKYDLEKNVNLIKFSEGKIDISINEILDKNFV